MEYDGKCTFRPNRVTACGMESVTLLVILDLFEFKLIVFSLPRIERRAMVNEQHHGATIQANNVQAAWIIRFVRTIYKWFVVVRMWLIPNDDENSWKSSLSNCHPWSVVMISNISNYLSYVVDFVCSSCWNSSSEAGLAKKSPILIGGGAVVISTRVKASAYLYVVFATYVPDFGAKLTNIIQMVYLTR